MNYQVNRFFRRIIGFILCLSGFCLLNNMALASETLDFTKSMQQVNPTVKTKLTNFDSGSKLLGNLKHTPSYIPRIYLTGAGGYDGPNALGQGDILLPIVARYDRNIFMYGQGRYSYDNDSWASNPWTGSIGVGYRQIIANSMVFGAYILGSDTKTNTKHSIYMASPGIELLGRAWEFRLNGYLPFKNTNWETEGWASDFGNYSYVQFKGHKEYDAKFIYHEEAGMGADTEIGRKLFSWDHLLVKGFFDGYYFRMQHNKPVYGGGAKLTFEPTNYLKFSIADTYDNHRKNVAMASLQLSIYDLFSSASSRPDPNDLQHKLYAPLERNFANIGSGSDARTTGGPDDKLAVAPQVVPVTPDDPKVDDIWFFYGGGNNVAANALAGNSDSDDTPDGTYKHPYSAADFNQATLHYIYSYQGNRKLVIYLSPGIYSAYTKNSSHYVPLELYQGMSIYGRMGKDKGFQKPAAGSSRPVLVGALKIPSSINLNDLVLRNNVVITGFETGISLDNSQNVVLRDVTVGANDINAGYQIGLNLSGSSALTLDDSSVYAYSDSANADAVGLYANGTVSINVSNHSLVNGTNDAGNGIGMKLNMDTPSKKIIKILNGDGTVSFNGYGAGTSEYGGYGFYAKGNAPINIGTITGITFTGKGEQSSQGDGFLVSSGAGDVTIGNITNASFLGSGKDGGQGVNISGVNNIQLGNITDSTFNGGGSNAMSAGLSINSGYNIAIGKIQHSKFIATTDADASGYGLYTDSDHNGNISIPSIDGSVFNGKGGKDGNGFYINNINDISILNGIASSSFKGTGSSGDGYGLNVAVGGSVHLGDVSNSSFNGDGVGSGYGVRFNTNKAQDLIGNISNSVFSGSGTAFTAGFYDNNPLSIQIGNITALSSFSSVSKSGNSYGMDVASNGSIKIGDIDHSTFSANSNSLGNVYGLYVYSINGEIEIGNIGDQSSFSGVGTAAASGAFLFSKNNMIQLGSIDGDSFLGKGANDDAFGLFVAANSTNAIKVKEIKNVSVTSSTFGMDFEAFNFWLNGVKINNAQEAMDNISGKSSFNTNPQTRVCVGFSCV